MQLTVIGCSGTFPGPTSACSSYLVEADGFRLLIDAGNGSTGPLQRWGGLLDVDAIYISHLHGDHYLDLVTYTYARHYHPDGTPPPLPVYGPSDIRGHVAGAFGRPVDELLAKVYDFIEVAPGRLDIGPFSLDLARMNHPVETNAVRIANGTSTLCYSADTGECDELVKLARNCDLFLCEASYLHSDDLPEGVHLSGRQAGEHATRADASRMVLTHLVPWFDNNRVVEEAATTYDGALSLASPGATYDI